MKAKVYRSTGSWYEVKAENNKFYKARLRGKFKQNDLKLSNPIAVGDNVEMELENESEETYVINEIFNRENYVIRKSSRKTGHNHIIAANLDLAVIIVSLKSPRTSLGFIDRFLVTAEAYSIEPLIILNKSDLVSEDKIELTKEIYTSIGYKVIVSSVQDNTGMDQIRKVISNKCSLFTGHSGVGKSSILNVLFPELDLRVNEISKHSDKGQHTTTYAEIFEPVENLLIIDTPGIKEFGLVEIGKNDLGHFFPEIRNILGDCKFNDCLHTNEPKCALKDISDSRYKNYLGLLDEC